MKSANLDMIMRILNGKRVSVLVQIVIVDIILAMEKFIVRWELFVDVIVRVKMEYI